MRSRALRTTGFAVLIAFVAATSWSVGLVPAPCCSAACESCPLTLCKGTDATPTPKVDTAQVPALVGRSLQRTFIALAERGTPRVLPRRAPESPPPLRN